MVGLEEGLYVIEVTRDGECTGAAARPPGLAQPVQGQWQEPSRAEGRSVMCELREHRERQTAEKRHLQETDRCSADAGGVPTGASAVGRAYPGRSRAPRPTSSPRGGGR